MTRPTPSFQLHRQVIVDLRLVLHQEAFVDVELPIVGHLDDPQRFIELMDEVRLRVDPYQTSRDRQQRLIRRRAFVFDVKQVLPVAVEVLVAVRVRTEEPFFQLQHHQLIDDGLEFASEEKLLLFRRLQARPVVRLEVVWGTTAPVDAEAKIFKNFVNFKLI